MICKYCEKEVPDGSLYCLYCGERLARKPKKKKGTITIPKPVQLPSGNWRIVLRAEGASGTFPSKEEAEIWAKAVRADYIKAKKAPKALTFGEALDAYVESKGNLLAPDTVREYKRSKNAELLPLRDKDVFKLTEDDMQRFVNDYALTHAERTVSNVYSRARAVILSVRKDAPVAATLPQKQRKMTYVPTDADIIKLYKAIKGTDLELPVFLASAGSLRRAEICALTTDDIRETGVFINKDLVKDEHNKWVVKQHPKEPDSERVAQLPPAVVEMCRQQLPIKLNPDSITKKFGKLLKELDVPHFRFHDLRKYWASVAYSEELPELYIMRNGGWKTMSTPQRVYIALREDKNSELSKAMTDKFEKNNNPAQEDGVT